MCSANPEADADGAMPGGHSAMVCGEKRAHQQADTQQNRRDVSQFYEALLLVSVRYSASDTPLESGKWADSPAALVLGNEGINAA